MEREYPVLAEHAWLASAVIAGANIAGAAAWLTTAWRLGKWYYSREVQVQRAENTWLRSRAEFLTRTLGKLVQSRQKKLSANHWRRNPDESPT